MVSKCEGCGEPLKGRQSKVCSDRCRKRVVRADAKKASGVERPDPSAAAGVELDVGVLVATARELARVGKLDSPVGRIALSLAGRLDRSLVDTGSSYAAIARELRATLDAALAGAVETADSVDELRARREARQRGVG